jgi:hypothetical protein
MAEQAPCPRCRHANPPENGFCGRCGASLEWGHELVPRREGALTAVRRTLPAKLGPAGKVVAVGLVTLAAEVGLSWLRRRTRSEGRPSTLSARQVDTAASERLLVESLEEVLVHGLEGGHRSRVFVRRAIRSLVITPPPDSWGQIHRTIGADHAGSGDP